MRLKEIESNLEAFDWKNGVAIYSLKTKQNNNNKDKRKWIQESQECGLYLSLRCLLDMVKLR